MQSLLTPFQSGQVGSISYSSGNQQVCYQNGINNVALSKPQQEGFFLAQLLPKQQNGSFDEFTIETRPCIGIDVGKKENRAYCLASNQALDFENNLAGYRCLIDWARELHGYSEVVFGVEPSGRFNRPLTAFLTCRGYKLVLVPGSMTKRAREEKNNSSNKTDSVDAQAISWVLKRRTSKYSFKQLSPLFAGLRELGVAHDHINQLWTKAFNRLHNLLEESFPEFHGVMNKNISTRTAREVLKRYGGPINIATERIAILEAFIYDASNRQHGRKKAVELRKAAKETIGIQHDTTELSIRSQLELIDQLEVQKRLIFSRIEEMLKQIPYAANLMTIPGIGPITTAVLLGQLGDLRQYQSCYQLYSAVGVNLVEASSGSIQGRLHISRQGNTRVRNAMYLAAESAFGRKASAFYPWFSQRHDKKRPGSRHILLVAGIRKLLRICHSIARANQPFNMSRH